MRVSLVLAVLVCLGGDVCADVLVRWDAEQIPSPMALGLTKIVIRAGNSKAIESALSLGYDVYLEQASRSGAVQIKRRNGPAKDMALDVDDRGKWPHIRTNWVTKRNDVLQVAGRSAQPWLESNVALLRIIQATRPGSTPILTYTWKPITVAEADEGPTLENYLVAIAEAGSFGGGLVLPLHERLQRDLLLGKPEARAAWKEIRRYLEFYAWSLPGRYRPMANVGILASDPMKSFELMNLLARHNIPFELIDPAHATAAGLAPFKLVIAVGEQPETPPAALAEYARNGGVVVTRPQVGDPNAFALEMRQKLGRANRVIDIWNGITVLAAPYEEPGGKGVLVTTVNYASQPLPVQMRVRGTFSQVYYESPEQDAALLPYEHRDGYTEFVIPALRIGGRVFLN